MSSMHDALFIRLFHKIAATTAKAGYDTYCIAFHPYEEKIQGVQIIPIPKSAGFFGRIISSFRVFRQALILRPKICHIHTPLLYPWIPLLRLNGIVVIIDMYENQCKSFELRTYIPLFLRAPCAFIYRFIEKILIYDIPVVFAEYSYKKDYAWIKRSCTVLNLPLLDALLSIKNDKKLTPTIGYLGAISEERGSVELLKAVAALKKRRISINLEFIGQASAVHQEHLNLIIDECSLQDQVVFHGFMQPKDAYKIVAQWHVGMAILLERKNYVESYPTKIFEYMALGLPVITSNFPLYAEIIQGENCGLCVDPIDSSALADAINTLFENALLANEMGKNGRSAVISRYSWETEEEKLLSFYEHLLNLNVVLK